MEAPPLSLYVHLPWCVRKCPYCDFNSHPARGEMPRRRYVSALLADLEHEARRVPGRRIESVFFGGGTPSLFPAADFAVLLEAVKRHFDLDPGAEITMEANPGTVESGSPRGYREAGINRLSVGAQSFDDASLERLGRIHRAADTSGTVRTARAAGFDNLNLDVMYGLPGQDVGHALADLDAALELAPEHLSWYELTLEPNTVFHARPPADLPDEDRLVAIHDAGARRLQSAGYERYEVSAWARDARYCRHNLNYWRYGDYAAVGAGAHGKLTNKDGIVRYAKPANPVMYMQAVESQSALADTVVVDDADRLFEFMLNGLRLTGGIELGQFEARTGVDRRTALAGLERLAARGLIVNDAPDGWRPTRRGLGFLNELTAEFLPDRTYPRCP